MGYTLTIIKERNWRRINQQQKGSFPAGDYVLYITLIGLKITHRRILRKRKEKKRKIVTRIDKTKKREKKDFQRDDVIQIYDGIVYSLSISKSIYIIIIIELRDNNNKNYVRQYYYPAQLIRLADAFMMSWIYIIKSLSNMNLVGLYRVCVIISL